MNVVDFAKDLFDPWHDCLVGVVEPGRDTMRGHFHVDGREFAVTVHLLGTTTPSAPLVEGASDATIEA